MFTGHVDGSPAPGDALLTGEDLGEDVGYGPPRLQSPVLTLDFARFLDAQDLPRLLSRVNIAQMRRAQVYSMPGGPDSEQAYETMLRNEVASHFPELHAYVAHMADKGYGLLSWIS